jgi:hypothetical protein
VPAAPQSIDRAGRKTLVSLRKRIDHGRIHDPHTRRPLRHYSGAGCQAVDKGHLSEELAGFQNGQRDHRPSILPLDANRTLLDQEDRRDATSWSQIYWTWVPDGRF